MARPIKETPVVTGKDAKRFAEKIAHLKPESKEEREAAKKVYAKFKAQWKSQTNLTPLAKKN